jgi:hypothetical protein
MDDISGSGKGGNSSSDAFMLFAIGIENLRRLVMLAKRLVVAMGSRCAMFVPEEFAVCLGPGIVAGEGDDARELDFPMRPRLDVEDTLNGRDCRVTLESLAARSRLCYLDDPGGCWKCGCGVYLAMRLTRCKSDRLPNAGGAICR